MTQIFILRHESNDFSEYDSTVAGAKLSTGAAAAMNGTNYGIIIDWDSADGPNARKDLTGLGFDITSGICNFQFYLNVNTTVAGSNGDQGTILLLQDNTFADDFFNVYYERTAGVLHLIVETTVDGGANVTADSGVLAAGDLKVRLELIRATTAVSNDGILSIYINDVLKDQTFNIDNFNDYAGIPTGHLLVTPSEAGAFTGDTYLDEISLNDNAIAAATDEYTAAPMKKPADIDSDGTNIYIGALNSLGFPVLIQFATALTTDGSVVFNPGAGDNIGVECSRGDANEITVAGQFNSTNVVERSEDAGVSFSVIDDATIGGIGAFKVGPDSDNRILVFDEDNNDLLETIDEGSNWTSINASVTPTIRAIGRLGQNVQECVFGNASAASDNIDYSINSGDDLEDYSGGFPQVDVNGVIIN